MIYCINPDCHHRENLENVEFCQACGTPLLIQGKYQLLQPLHPLDPDRSTEIFEVADAEERKVMKILKRNSPKLIELFEQEAFTLSVLNHPSIPKIDLDGDFTVQLPTGKTLHCLVMEKIEGQNLEQWVQVNGKISQKLARNWLKQLLGILDYIHNNGFFHRDIKPSNIMLKPDGSLAIIDFGTVREITDTYMIAFRGSSQPNITSIVSRGYTAPEQFNGKALPQSDLFSLGRTFVHLLTGISPSELPNHPQTNQLIWRSRSPQISRLFADLIDDLMAPLPKDRPKDSSAVLSALDNLFLKSIERFVTSSRFKAIAKVSVTFGIILGVAGYIVNKVVISPLRADAYSAEGRQALMSGDLDIAREKFEQAINYNPRESVFYNDLGLVCSLQQEYYCAIEKYEKSLDIASKSETVEITHYNLGTVYQNMQKYEAALEQYEIVMESANDIAISAKNSYARLQIWQYHNYNRAIELLNTCLTELSQSNLPEDNINSLKSTTYKNLGWAYMQKGDYQRAENFLTKAISFDVDNSASPHCLLAKTLQAKQNTDEALISWQKCRNNDPGNLPEVKTWQGDAERYLINIEENS